MPYSIDPQVAQQISQGFNNSFGLGQNNNSNNQSQQDMDDDEKRRQELMRQAQRSALQRMLVNNP
jgi:hypothetical protein